MPTPPLVSVIIPCHNAAPRLAACLESCLTQSYPYLEIILVDDHSTDHSLEIALQIAQGTTRPLHVIECPQFGANNARNHGFTHAQGYYIQWLDADDELASDKIALQVAALEQAPAFHIACGDWEWHYTYPGHSPFRIGFSALCLDDSLLQALLEHWHPPHAYLLRRAITQQLHDLQAWYPNSPIGNDREYFTTAAILGSRFLPVPGATVRYYTWSDTQLTKSTPYSVRIATMKQIYERLYERIRHRPLRSISGLHWFLLRQNWDLWKLAPGHIKPLGTHGYWIKRQDNAVGMTLTPGEARIAIAMSQMERVATLDDHAHQILRFLWRQAALQSGSSATVETQLAQWVGPLPSEPTLQSVPANPPTPEQHALVRAIDTLPLYAPIFPHVRLSILQLLEQFRVVGLLQQCPLPDQNPSV